MLNEKEMKALAAQTLADHEQAQFVTVFPDGNCFLNSGDNFAKYHARNSGLAGLKVERSFGPSEEELAAQAEAKAKADAEKAEAKAKADAEKAEVKAKADAQKAEAKAKAEAEKKSKTETPKTDQV